jgi:hypothetical protein
LSLPALVSRAFAVAVGKPAQLGYCSGALSVTKKFAGEYFSVPPQINLFDAGGNLVAMDNSNAVRVSIYGNPTGATIGPNSSLFVVAKKGVVTFNSLKIDKPGLNYTLLFTLYRFNRTYTNFSATTVTFLSEKFHVYDGPVRKLAIIQPASDAWAGNQVAPFVLTLMIYVSLIMDLGGSAVRRATGCSNCGIRRSISA